jgi:hypothetical protein
VPVGLMMSASGDLPGGFVNRAGFISVDQGAKQHTRTFRLGIITCDPNRRILSAVKNISPTGALIEVDNALEIPLAIESESSVRVCHVAWKKANQIAVNFDGARGHTGGQEGQPNGRQDRRQAPRRNVNTMGWLRLGGSFATAECKIVDVSTAGVRLAIPFASKLPETFTVFFSKRAQGHQVRVIWRRGNQIGAKFI